MFSKQMSFSAKKKFAIASRLSTDSCFMHSQTIQTTKCESSSSLCIISLSSTTLNFNGNQQNSNKSDHSFFVLLLKYGRWTRVIEVVSMWKKKYKRQKKSELNDKRKIEMTDKWFEIFELLYLQYVGR